MNVNHEGGFAATIVSLFANQKLSFRTEVPEQVKEIFILKLANAGSTVFVPLPHYVKIKVLFQPLLDTIERKASKKYSLFNSVS